MAELRFDGRTAIVTGAGGNPSLGRAHAMLLAARGANVVVNDIGGGAGPAGSASAQAVADEIVALGGKAVADTNSVATPEGAAAMVKTALDAFGGIDIIVNNAGVVYVAPLEEITIRDYQRTAEVNLLGPMYLVRAAWPHMKAKGYGRIVNIASSSMFGCALQIAYGATKGGMLALTQGLAAEGEPYGIKVNAVGPGAFTRMVIAAREEDSRAYQYSKQHMPAELVSPAIAFFAHEDCPVTGECLEVMGGGVRRVYYARTEGITDLELTPEKIVERWDEITAGTSERRIPPAEMDGFSAQGRPYVPSE